MDRIVCSATLALFLTVGTICAATPLSWQNIQPISSSVLRSRWYAGSVVYSNRLYVFGGEGSPSGVNDTGIFGDTLRFDFGNSDWAVVDPPSGSATPSPRYGFVSGLVNNFWIVSHGCDQTQCFSDTWALNLDTNEWLLLVNTSSVTFPYPQARFTTAGGIYPGQNTLWLSMGETSSGRKLSDTWIFRVSFAMDGTNIIFNGKKISSIFLGPSSGNVAILLGGSQTWGPGIFPQPLSADEYNSSEVYVMTLNPNATLNQTQWKRVLVTSDDVPDLLEGVSLSVDTAAGVVYLFGGRLLGTLEYRRSVWRLSGDGADDINQPCPSPQFTYIHLHGIFMYVAWGLLLPLGALLGRYYKWAWPCWFILHVICQSLGVLFTVAGFVVVFLIGSYSEPNFAHAIIGIVLTALLIQQYLSGIFHPCVDKENGKTHKDDKSIFRKCWEVYHAVSGLISIAIGIGQVTLGVFLVVAPLEVWAVWCGLGGLWIIVFLVHECGFLCYKISHRNRDIE